MKNKLKATGLFVSLIICLTLFCVYVYVATIRKFDFVQIAIFGAIGLIAFYFIHNIIHELGHFLVGKLFGLDCLQFGTDLWQITKYYEKPVFEFRTSKNAGEVTLIGKDYKNAYDYIVIAAAGGILFSFLFIGLCIIFGNLSNKAWVYGLLNFGTLSSVFVLINNLTFEDVTNDGYYVFKHNKGSYGKCLKNKTEILSRLYCGQKLSEIPEELFRVDGASTDESAMLKYYKALKYMYLGNYRDAKMEFGGVISRDCGEELLTHSNEELFYIALITGNKDYVTKHKNEILPIIEEDESPAGYRIQALYRLINGENEWGGILISTAKKLAENYIISGLADFELTLISRDFN